MTDPVETTQAIAEAVTSVSDTARKGIELSEKAGAFLVRLLGKDAAGIMHDAMFYFRARNAVALQDKLDRILEERRIRNPKAIPLRLAIPFLEAATLEDDDTLQERWARLLANAMDPDFKFEMQRYFGSILSGLSPLDCLAFEVMAATTEADSRTEITPQLLATILALDEETVCVSLGNLMRQGLVERKPKSGGGIGFIKTWLFKNSAFYITDLGNSFQRACTEKPRSMGA